jgi:arylsulfatase A-like enzyme
MNPALLSFTFIFLAAASGLEAGEPAPPNILLIYSDDHGWADLGLQGVDKDIRTPNLDQLARDGVRFSRGYVSAPQCVPSRCGVITGRYQQRFGVEDNNRGPLPLEERTLAERLRPAGYVSGWVGKSHLDVSGKGAGGKAARLLPDHFPHRQGFEEYFRGEMRQYHASHDLQGVPFADAPHLVTDNRFRVVVQTEAALSFLDRRSAKPGQPWFLYLAWYAPHVPLESPEPWFSQTPETLPLQRRQALAMIGAMDDGLGRIRAKLRTIGAERNTLIFFIGDNGAPLGDSWDGSLNLPLAGQKGMLAEGGIRVPFIASWPARWPSGLTYDQPVINLDVAATATAAAGLPPDPALDGIDLTPFVTGVEKSGPHRNLFWRWGSQAAILEMPWKLIQLGKMPPLLFDLTTPQGETFARNLSGQHPEIVARLEQQLQSWAAELQPPGLIRDDSAFSRHHETMFAEHHITASAGSSPKKQIPADSDQTAQGWIARNAALSLRDGALTLIPEAGSPPNVRPFLTNSSLDLPGPESVSLRLRAKSAGQGQATLTWRTKEESFSPRQSIAFDWPVGTAWQDVQIPLAETSRILHLRLTPPRSASGVEIQRIDLRSSAQPPVVFSFDPKEAARPAERPD